MIGNFITLVVAIFVLYYGINQLLNFYNITINSFNTYSAFYIFMALNIWIIGGSTDISDDDIYKIMGLVTNIDVPKKLVTSVTQLSIKAKDLDEGGIMINNPRKVILSTVI